MNYSNLVETFQIGIIGKGKLFSDNVLVHTFRYNDSEHNVNLGGNISIITVELVKTDKIVDKSPKDMNPAELWSVFFRYLTSKEKREKINEILQAKEEIAMAGHTLIHITQEQKDQAYELSRLKYELDLQSDLTEAEQNGHAKGRAEGIKEGMETGIKEGLYKTARNALAEGSTPEFVQKITGLTIEEIKNLA